MRTLKGYEAIEVAERYNILLYKFTTQSEVTAQEAREDVKTRGNAAAYVIEAWPDSEEEAEQLVLKAIEEQLRTTRSSATTVEELTANTGGDRFIHSAATELAVERLVEKGTLAMLEEADGEAVYVLTRALAFTDNFIKHLQSVVCEECADLNLEGPFHESCLLDLFEFLHTYQLSLDDLQEVPAAPHRTPVRGSSPGKASSGMQWLSKTVSVTRSRWKTVVEPIIKNRLTGKPVDKETDASIPDSTGEPLTTSEVEADAESSADTVEKLPATNDDAQSTVSSNQENERPKVTKSDLIRYLQSIEVLDEGELDTLRDEREQLLRELENKESQIQQLMHQKSKLESQYAQLQQDMDVMVRAMRIARQHDSPAPSEVITAYESENNRD